MNPHAEDEFFLWCFAVPASLIIALFVLNLFR